MRLPFSITSGSFTVSLKAERSAECLIDAFEAAVRDELRRGETVTRSGDTVSFESGGTKVDVVLRSEPEQATASYDIDGSGYLRPLFLLGVVLGVMFGQYQPLMGLSLFVGVVVWVGYGNLYLTFRAMKSQVGVCLRNAARACPDIATGELLWDRYSHGLWGKWSRPLGEEGWIPSPGGDQAN